MSPALYSKASRPHYDNAEHMMELLGGSFIKALVNLWYCADTINKQRVRSAFSDHFDRYEQMFKEWNRSNAGGAA